MIRERRVIHRRVFSVLLVAMPALLIASIMVRPQLPPVSELDQELLALSGSVARPGGKPSRVYIGGRQFEAWGVAPNQLILRPTTEILKPELRVFWTADARVDRSTHLGRLAGDDYRVMTLPKPAVEGLGALVIYSVATAETFGSITMKDLLEE